MGFQTKVYKDEGGDRMTVASGGEIRMQAGSTITNLGTQAANIATMTASSAAVSFARINSIIVALRGVRIFAT